MNKYNALIMVVEDDEAVRRALLTGLQKKGFQTCFAVNGKEALEVVKEKNPDLILLDIIMPIMDGVTFLERFRKDEQNKNMPIIILTNLNDARQLDYALSKGAKDYLIKSDWKLSDLVTKIKERLNLN